MWVEFKHTKIKSFHFIILVYILNYTSGENVGEIMSEKRRVCLALF